MVTNSQEIANASASGCRGNFIRKNKVLTLVSKGQLLANNDYSPIGYNQPVKLTLGQ